jgi:hypothetical protein
MGHGGKRVGAGRPRLLSADQHIDVVKDYIVLRDQLYQQKYKEALNQHPELSATSSELKKFKQPARAIWASLPEPVGQRDHPIDAYVDERTGYIEETLKGSRIIHIRHPTKFRSKLLKQVAAEATKRFGVPVTPRQVETCLEEWAQK